MSENVTKKRNKTRLSSGDSLLIENVIAKRQYGQARQKNKSGRETKGQQTAKGRMQNGQKARKAGKEGRIKAKSKVQTKPENHVIHKIQFGKTIREKSAFSCLQIA